MLDEHPEITLVKTSDLYSTEPVGYTEQPEFLNAAAAIDTTLHAHELLEYTRSIELKLGRITRQKWHEREIDIDILLFGSEVIHTEQLSVPHPELSNRGFVLYPLHQIAPLVIHPVFGKSIHELLLALPDTASVRKYRNVSLFDKDSEHGANK